MVAIYEMVLAAYAVDTAHGYGNDGKWNMNDFCKGQNSFSSTSKEGQHTLYRHRNGTNFIYWDGHVSFVNPLKDSKFISKHFYNVK